MFIGIYFAGGKGTWKTMATRAKVRYGGIRLKKMYDANRPGPRQLTEMKEKLEAAIKKRMSETFF